MRLFFLLFLAVYGGMHAYMFLKLRAAFPQMGRWWMALVGFILMMLVGPMFVRALDGAGRLTLARILAYVVYVWMAVIVWSFVLFLCADVWNLAVWLAGLAAPGVRVLLLAPRPVVVGSGVLILAATIWGLVEASNIGVTEITIPTHRLPPGSKPIRLVQISDVHIGLIMREGRLRRVVNLVNSLDPDIVVSTGDLVDSSLYDSDLLAGMLAAIRPPLGKFAVMGNHEFYSGIDKAIAFHKAAGFRVLRGESAVIDGRLRIGGVDDPAGDRRGGGSFTDETLALPEEPEMATVFLKHRPVVLDSSAGRFDVQVSGHVHGGQFFPFGLVTRLVFPMTPGLHRLENGSYLSVTRGTGTWGPPVRLFTPPEVVHVTLVPADGANADADNAESR